MQNITISGNVGRDPELRSVGDGQVCSFSVAVKQGWGDKERTNWYRCSVWGKRAESVHRYLRKGAKVFVTGGFEIGEYDGKPQYEVRVAEVDWQASDAAPAQSSGGAADRRGGGFDDLSDEIPF